MLDFPGGILQQDLCDKILDREAGTRDHSILSAKRKLRKDDQPIGHQSLGEVLKVGKLAVLTQSIPLSCMRFTHPVFAKCRKNLLIPGDRVARKNSGTRMAKTAAFERIKDSRGRRRQACTAVVATGPASRRKMCTGRIEPSGHT